MEHFPLIIIGAGPTGLGAAWHCHRHSSTPCLLLEAADRAGGLSASFTDPAGFTWDLGSHLQFSHYQYLDDVLDSILDETCWNRHQRSTFVWFGDRFVPYPFQLNLHRLPPAARWDCVQGLLERPMGPPQRANFGVWCRSVFGDAITAQFMRPYNEKLWACPLEDMSADWIAERVAIPDLHEVLRNLCLSTDQSSWGPNAVFRYPRQGGAGSVWQSVARQLPEASIRYHARVTSIDAAAHCLLTSNGQRLSYDNLLTTVPLPTLRQLLQCPAMMRDVTRLRHTRTHVVGLGLRGHPPAALAGQCWSYFPQSTIPFYRLTVLSNLSEAMVPDVDNSWSVMAEVAEPYATQLDQEEVVRSVIAAGESLQLLQRSDLLSVWHQRLPFGYPVPTLDRDGLLDDINGHLEWADIYSRGRFGAWKYEVSNQDHSFMQGVECIDRLLYGHVEPTLNPRASDILLSG